MLCSRINPWYANEFLRFFYEFKDFFTFKKVLNFTLDLHQVTPFPTTPLSLFSSGKVDI